jgi:membrane protein implicated in regulation of membrane protease activity
MIQDARAVYRPGLFADTGRMVPGLRRWSLPWWLVMAGMTGSLGTASAATLWWFDLLRDGQAIAMALGVIIIGDVLAAIGLAMIAPTRITLRPGERGPAIATVVAGFTDGRHGRVRIHGETWPARLADGAPVPPPGGHILVQDRDGLVLIVGQPPQQRH